MLYCSVSATTTPLSTLPSAVSYLGGREGGREGVVDANCLVRGYKVSHSIVKSLGSALCSKSPYCSISFPVNLCVCVCVCVCVCIASIYPNNLESDV